jgi:DNA polymerase-3 subunit epsilon
VQLVRRGVEAEALGERYRKGKRTLEVVAAHYAVTLTGAHDAAADAIAAGRVAQDRADRCG